MQNEIEKSIDLNASLARVWQALTDYREFGEWFRVKLDGPFTVGKVVSGHITYPGYEHLPWAVEVKAMEPQWLFSFTWHPYAVDSEVDYSAEPQTLVEFKLEPITSDRTRLVIVESGFNALPQSRYADAFRMNSGGWAEQINNIRDHVER